MKSKNIHKIKRFFSTLTLVLVAVFALRVDMLVEAGPAVAAATAQVNTQPNGLTVQKIQIDSSAVVISSVSSFMASLPKLLVVNTREQNNLQINTQQFNLFAQQLNVQQIQTVKTEALQTTAAQVATVNPVSQNTFYAQTSSSKSLVVIAQSDYRTIAYPVASDINKYVLSNQTSSVNFAFVISSFAGEKNPLTINLLSQSLLILMLGALGYAISKSKSLTINKFEVLRC